MRFGEMQTQNFCILFIVLTFCSLSKFTLAKIFLLAMGNVKPLYNLRQVWAKLVIFFVLVCDIIFVLNKGDTKWR